MNEDLKKLIKNYGIDVEDEFLKDASPFEINYTFETRQYLAKNYQLLDSEDKEKLEYFDAILFSRAREFYDYLKPVGVWGNNLPLEYWWWHLDKIILGELAVDVSKKQINYQGKIIKLG
ncbi:MAG: hypothetical protein H6Q67_2402 [Firmicutes bacterium]|nr:hypothetical protein [Bacillota bacterium]